MTKGFLRIGPVVTAIGCGRAHRILTTLDNHLAAWGHRVNPFALHEPEISFQLDVGVAVWAIATELPLVQDGEAAAMEAAPERLMGSKDEPRRIAARAADLVVHLDAGRILAERERPCFDVVHGRRTRSDGP
ncbi:MAG TPA: hypothetical protein PLS53_01685 [Thermoanaerobaculaceae bacterium]|nr:hypothetical protein [Thermoanaerobaculaceae bacterium]HPS76847.1 hypothetical protein [Thermoanaerobaculaceae bacterium]